MFPAYLKLLPLKRDVMSCTKRQAVSELHGVTNQKAVPFSATAVKPEQQHGLTHNSGVIEFVHSGALPSTSIQPTVIEVINKFQCFTKKGDIIDVYIAANLIDISSNLIWDIAGSNLT